MSSQSNDDTKSPLTAAQAIVEELTGMTPEHQVLALRFAIETLGLKFPVGTSQAATPPATTQMVSQPDQAKQPPTGNADHSTDIRSFTELKSPKSDQQFTAVVAYFYHFKAKPEERKETIDAETMKEAARLAGRPQVSRWAMTLTNAKNAGYLDLVGDGNFRLSSVGENLVAITLPDGTAPARPKRINNNKKLKKKSVDKKATNKSSKKTTKNKS